jgi:hypothetical protein
MDLLTTHPHPSLDGARRRTVAAYHPCDRLRADSIQQRNHAGIGAVAGGISEVSVLLVPLLFGVIGVLITLGQIERRKS